MKEILTCQGTIPKVIPVLDVRNGIVVRAVAGRRSEYRPLVSRITDSIDPVDVAIALRERCGSPEIYLADLDGIERGWPDFGIVANLRQKGFRVLFDPGIRTHQDGAIVVDDPGITMVAGLETLADTEELFLLVKRVGAERLVFSLDLVDGKPMGNSAWPRNMTALIETVVGLGVRRMIVLDLAKVGVGQGTGSEALCQFIKKNWPELELIAGGGVRGIEDLRKLKAAGVSAALVASALHDGSLFHQA